MRLSSLASCALAILILSTASAEDWPGFRGPTGLGYSNSQNLPIEWGGDDATNIVWQSPLIGEGHASPIVSGDRLFVCTAHWDDTVTNREQVIPEHHVLCYDTSDGTPLWDVTVEPGPWLRNDFRSGPGGGYAAPSPATDGEYVYVVFGSSVVAALDFDGNIVWRKVIDPYTFDVTIGSSPVVFQDTVLMLCAMANKPDSRLIAFTSSDGTVKWQTPLPNTGFAHSTPVLIDVAGQSQLIIVASGGGETDEGVQSFDPTTGERIWWCRGGGDASSAAYGAGIIYCDSGRGGPGIAIDPGGSGDVTGTHIQWRIEQVPEGIGSPIIVNERVYRLHNPNVLKCWNATNGELVYNQRLDELTSTWISPLADTNGRLYFASAGVSCVIQSGDEFQLLATNDLGDPNHASAAASGDRLYFVGTRQVYCVGGN